jgi:hypothetical protein
MTSRQAEEQAGELVFEENGTSANSARKASNSFFVSPEEVNVYLFCHIIPVYIFN